MHRKKPVIVFNFSGVFVEYGSIKETCKELNIGQDKVKRTIDKGRAIPTSLGKVFMDYKIEDFTDGKERR